jgi:NADH:ubiquinone oxidoreductase subunit 2 (subunit N)
VYLFLLTLSIVNILTYIYVYISIYTVALTILFLLLLPTFSNTNTFYEFKAIHNVAYKFLFLTVFLSMAGVPPLGGFFAKLALLSLFMNSYSIILYVFFTALFLFALYFYLKNVRFLILPFNSSAANYLIHNSFISNLTLVLTFILVFNFFIFNDVVVLIT